MKLGENTVLQAQEQPGFNLVYMKAREFSGFLICITGKLRFYSGREAGNCIQGSL